MAALAAEPSTGQANRRETSQLPDEVVQCLENARFLHLATCTDNQPHVSLMNYTYLPSSPYSPSLPVIVMTTNPQSKKTSNLVANPNVSLLVHDWVSHRPPTSRRAGSLSGSPPPDHRTPTTSGLAALLFNLNTSAISSISATINGSARILTRGSDEERFYRERHLENNTFGTDGGAMGDESDGGRECFVAGDEVQVIVVKINDVRISDWKGSVKDWVLVESTESAVNGVR